MLCSVKSKKLEEWTNGISRSIFQLESEEHCSTAKRRKGDKTNRLYLSFSRKNCGPGGRERERERERERQIVCGRE
jgi:hypothetical protein